ncbi:asparagine synthase (glutamine-hydrolyzing) [bacterium]|nr:asparagine synthase (glutamine-hydrolyzing) [bacterium]
MCGICGFIDFNSASNIELLDAMTSTLHHRGPDHRGTEIYKHKNLVVGFGQTRLSIIDLSPKGNQPMEYENYSIVFNGEIYNFEDLKKELTTLGHKFVSDSDTEVILHSFKEWGVSCVSKFIGMFAFVIFDKLKNEITIVRDRAGVKPLFYYWKDNLFLFSSELKTFHKHTSFVKKINNKAIHQFMDFGYIPSPYCIFEHCKKLNPGNFLKLSLDKKEIEITKYWDVMDFYKLPKLKISYDEAKIEVEKLLISACEYRMVSDVPVGVFLSGGFDSTAVTALLQRNRNDKLKTFTIGFEEGNNEAPFAKDIAKFLGTNHTEYYCTYKEAKDIIPNLSFYYDEPFADSSAIPTSLISKLARKSVTVALSADAGDELFAGYNIHRTFLNNLSTINKIPLILYKPVGILLRIFSMIMPKLKYGLKHKLMTLSKVLRSDKNKFHQELYRGYFSLANAIKKDLFKVKLNLPETIFDLDFTGFKRDLSIPLAIDYSMYLQNDILVKVDRATMSVSLEGREPFLDHRIIEYVAQLPIEFKYGKNQKRILKDIVYKYVPKELMDRPKTGFSIPIYNWLKTDLKYLIEENLDYSSIKETGIFNFSAVERIKNQFFNDQLDDITLIWKLLQFQMWYKKWM